METRHGFVIRIDACILSFIQTYQVCGKMNQPSGSTYSISQTQRVLQILRTRIVRGKYAPGSRLPTFEQLESQLDAGRTVIQIAIAELKTEGFVTSRPRQGLYIAQSPPHLGRYALVFPCFPDHRQWSGFHAAMMQEALRINVQRSATRFELYHGVNDERQGGRVLSTLLNEVQYQRLAGLILLPETHDLALHSVVKESQIPLTIIDGEREKTPRPQICTDIPMMLDCGIGWLRQVGRKRIAMVYMADTFTWLTPDRFELTGITYRKAWLQSIGRSHPQTVEAVIHLLMDYPTNKRPDGLFIADDNLVELSLDALDAIGLQIGKDIDVIAHMNWPSLVKSKHSIQRIGFDSGRILKTCINVLAKPFEDTVDERVLIIPAVLESEMDKQ